MLGKLRWLCNYPVWAIKYLRLKLGLNVLRDIKILSIEFSSVCNLRCKYCFIEQNDRTRFLDINIYEKLIKEVAENPKYKIRTMEWPISGEFFVYKNFKEVIQITKKYWDANAHFRPHILLNENLTLLDAERIDLILKSGIVAQVICSIDGRDAQSFEDMRPPAKFEKVLHNYRNLVKRNRELSHPVFIKVNNGRDEQSQVKEFSREMRGIFAVADDISFWHPKFWNESFNSKEKKFYPAKGFCTFVFNNVTLSANGSIAKCCMDLKGATVYADLAKHSLEEIWHSNVRKEFLEMMFKNRRSGLSGCKTCSITNTNNDNHFNNWAKVLKRKYVLPFQRRRFKTAENTLTTAVEQKEYAGIN